MAGKINRDFFFKQIRSSLLGGAIRQSQVDGLTALLDHWEATYATSDDRWLAYILSTAFHETAHTLQPIKEFGGDAYFTKMYDIEGARPKLAKSLGNTTPGDGKKYPGRGFVQITGKANYASWTKRLNLPGVDLVATPDKAMDLEIATIIIFQGMILGTFTGKKLSNYFTNAAEDWTGARSIVNPGEKALMIADYARKFYGSISYTTGA